MPPSHLPFPNPISPRYAPCLVPICGCAPALPPPLPPQMDRDDSGTVDWHEFRTLPHAFTAPLFRTTPPFPPTPPHPPPCIHSSPFPYHPPLPPPHRYPTLLPPNPPHRWIGMTPEQSTGTSSV